MEKNGTVMDYLRWRGDLPFTRDGFNEVDDASSPISISAGLTI